MAMSRGKQIVIGILLGVVIGAVVGALGAVLGFPVAVAGGVTGVFLAGAFVVMQRRAKAESAPGPSDSPGR